MYYMVKEVADLTGISIRMLHYYDKIGVLKPESISASGYRLYTDNDLEKLQQLLFFKELDFSLNEIKEMVKSPNYDKREALIAHKTILTEKKNRLEKIIDTVDKTINSLEGGTKMSKKDMFEAFDMSEIEKHQKKYAEETKQKYGESDAYKESQAKTQNYTKEDWERIVGESDNIYRTLAANMDKKPDDPIIQEQVEKYRKHISKYFYNCTLEIYRGLGEMYVSDSRFTKNIDKYGIGLSSFLREAINIYCDSQS